MIPQDPGDLTIVCVDKESPTRFQLLQENGIRSTWSWRFYDQPVILKRCG